MTENQNHKIEKIIVDLCFRIERMCRYSPLDNEEIDDQSMDDRRMIAKFYCRHIDRGENKEIAERKAKAQAISTAIVDASKEIL